MARIPAVQIGGAGNARSAAVNPNVPQPRPDFGGLTRVAETLLERAREDENHKDNIRSVQIQEEYKRRSLEAIAQRNPLEEGYPERVRADLTELRQGLMEDPGISSREVMEDLDFRLTGALERDVTTSTVTRRAALQDEAIRVQDELGDLTLEQIRDDPDGSDEALAEFADQARRLNSAIAPELIEARSAKFGDRALQAKIEGLALAGRFDEARVLLEEEGGAFTPEVNRNVGRLIREIQNKSLADAQARVNRRIADMNIRVIDATSGAQLAAIRSEIEKMDADGLLPGQLQGTKVSIIRSIAAKQASLAKDGRKLAEALAAREAGTLHKPAEVDLVYDHEFGQLAEESGGQPEPAAMMDHLAGFVAQTGRMPSRQKAFIENAEVANDPQQLATAALLDRRVTDAAPDAQTGAGPRVELTRALMEHAGMDAGAAAQRVIEQVPDRATAEQRRKEFTEDVFPDFDAGQFFNREVMKRGFVERNLPFFGSEDIDVPASVQRKTEEAFATFYRLMGDEDTALQATANAMRRRFGTTKVGRSKPTATEWPVERHYWPGELGAVVAQNPELQERIITGDVTDALASVLGHRAEPAEGGGVVIDLDSLNIPDPPGGLEDVPPYSLVSDEVTERSLAQGARPSWELRVRDDFGNLVPLRVDTPGGSVNLRLVAPTAEEVRAMPAWREHLQTQENELRFKQQLERSLEVAPDTPFLGRTGEITDMILGNVTEGETNEIMRSLSEAPQFRREDFPYLPPRTERVPDEAVREPEETVSEVGRGANPPAPIQIRRSGVDFKGEVPRGVRNMNPGNIERNQITWQGMSDNQSGDDRFVVFSHPKYGVRALARVLLNYESIHGLDTVQGIISRWAPPTENATREYVDAVAKSLGVGRRQRLDLQDDEVVRGLVEAIIRHENGVQPYSAELLAEGIQLAR